MTVDILCNRPFDFCRTHTAKCSTRQCIKHTYIYTSRDLYLTIKYYLYVTRDSKTGRANNLRKLLVTTEKRDPYILVKDNVYQLPNTANRSKYLPPQYERVCHTLLFSVTFDLLISFNTSFANLVTIKIQRSNKKYFSKCTSVKV